MPQPEALSFKHISRQTGENYFKNIEIKSDFLLQFFVLPTFPILELSTQTLKRLFALFKSSQGLNQKFYWPNLLLNIL